MERLDKFLCACGAGTRSQVRELLRGGAVTVDGITERDGARKIDETRQEIRLRGQVMGKTGTVAVMLNKPAGFVTATSDDAEKTVMELLPPEYAALSLRPVGRLDKATEGLLLFTNDGDLLHRLISPKKGVEKVYYARHEGIASASDAEAFSQGLTLADGTVCLPATLTVLAPGEALVTVCEGKYHMVRRMMASRGLPVTYLERRREGTLTLGDLPRGKTRMLTKTELEMLDGEAR